MLTREEYISIVLESHLESIQQDLIDSIRGLATDEEIDELLDNYYVAREAYTWFENNL